MTPKKFFILFLVTFFIKLLSCYYLAFLGDCMLPGTDNTLFAAKQGDAPGYVDPIDNLIERGEYYFQDGDRKVSIGRAPYYGAVYFLFRLFFEKETAYDAVAIFQILCEAIAIIYLSLLSERILKSGVAFWVTYLLMMLSLNSTFWANALLTESLSISFLIFFVWHYYKYLHDKKRRSLFLSGLFLSFAILLKPYFALLYAPVGILLLFEKPFLPGKLALKVLLLSCSLVILSTPFAIRNLIRFGKYQPFSEFYAGYNFTKATFAYRGFIQAWGGSIIFWDKRSAACYFEPAPDIPCQFVFPDYAFCEGYSIKKIENVRNLFITYRKNRSQMLEDSVTNEFNRLTALYKQYKPVRFYLISPIMLVREFLFHSGSYYLPISKSSPCYKTYQLFLKVSQSLLYYFSLFAGFAGLILIFRKDPKTYMLLLIPLYLIVFFAMVIKAPEFRYFAPSYPFLILGATFICTGMYARVKRLRISRQTKA